MKKLVITIGALVAAATLGYSQGYVTLTTVSPELVSTNSAASQYAGGTANAVGTGSGPSGVNASALYYMAVLVQAYNGTLSTDTSFGDGSWLSTGLQTQNAVSGQPGKFLGLSDVLANNWNVGAVSNFVVVAWSASEGSSLSTVLADLTSGQWAAAGYFGASAIASGASGPPPTGTPLNLFGTIGSGITMNGVAPLSVPEPGTMALAGLGGLSMLLFRRKK